MATSPIAAFGANGIWTGSEMIVWGGLDSSAGAAYDPARDSWRRIATLPGRGANRAFAWTGQQIVAWRNAASPVGFSYDPLPDAWTRLPAAPAKGPASQAVWTGTEVILVTDDGETAAFDPAGRTWRRLGTAPFGRDTDQLMWTGASVLLFAWPGDAPGAVLYAFLDPTVGEWVDHGETPLLNYHSDEGVWAGDRAVFLSGEPSDPNAPLPLAHGSIGSASLDPALDQWQPLAGECLSTNEAVWTGRVVLANSAAYDPLAGRCLTADRAPERANGYGRYGEVRVWTGDEMIIWSGGGGEGTPPLRDGFAFRPDAP